MHIFIRYFQNKMIHKRTILNWCTNILYWYDLYYDCVTFNSMHLTCLWSNFILDWWIGADWFSWKKLNIMLGGKTYFINRCKTPKKRDHNDEILWFVEHYTQEKILMRYCNAITKGRWDSFDLFECAIYSTNYFLFALERIHALKGNTVNYYILCCFTWE